METPPFDHLSSVVVHKQNDGGARLDEQQKGDFYTRLFSHKCDRN